MNGRQFPPGCHWSQWYYDVCGQGNDNIHESLIYAKLNLLRDIVLLLSI